MTNRRYATKSALIVGFVALAIALLTARAAPMDGYEASIYAATPLGYWIGAALAAVVAMGVMAYDRQGWRFSASIALFIAAAGSVVFLPTIRSYFAYGQGDALTHLGWMRRILSGEWTGFELVYPGTHQVATLVYAMTGLSPSHSMLLVLELFALSYLVFLPLAVRTVLNDRSAVAIATVAAGMFLPVTNLSTYLDYHPFTLTTFYFSFVLYLTFVYLRSTGGGSVREVFGSPIGLLLTYTLFAVVLFHPQVALNVLILLGTISAVQLLVRWLPSTVGMERGRLLLAPTAICSLLFALWALRYEVVRRMFGYVVEAVGSFWATGGANTGQNVQQQGGSLSEIGVSLLEVFVRMLGVQMLFSLIATGIVLWALAGRLSDLRTERNAVIGYITYGSIVLTPYFFLHFLGDISTYFFRHLGFAMVLVTVLATFALHGVSERLRGTTVFAVMKPLGVLAAVAVLALALFTVYPSPFVFQTTQGVPQSEMAGHDFAFETTGEDIPYAGIRQGPGRYEDALHEEVESVSAVNGTVMANGGLVEARDEPYYVIVSAYDRSVETEGFRGATYSEQAFESLQTEEGVSRVQVTGGFSRYYVVAGNESAGNGSAGGASAGNGSAGNASTGNGSTASGSTANGSTANGSTGNGSTANGSTANGSTANGSTATTSTANASTGNASTAGGSGANESTGNGSAGNGSSGDNSTGTDG